MRLTVSRLAKMAPNLKELRVHFCPKGSASEGARDYLKKFYPSIKADNPKLPVLIRECEGVQPRLWARYALGKETSIPLTNKTAEDINQQVLAMGK